MNTGQWTEVNEEWFVRRLRDIVKEKQHLYASKTWKDWSRGSTGPAEAIILRGHRKFTQVACKRSLIIYCTDFGSDSLLHQKDISFSVAQIGLVSL
jgi:hypothetical protein